MYGAFRIGGNTMTKGYLAFDFGASSGRLVLGALREGKLELEEIHRFANEPVHANGTMYWDLLRLFHEMKEGLKKAATRKDIVIEGIGIDTWGVDGVWLDQDGQILGNPIHYRDARTSQIMDEIECYMSEEMLFEKTGIQKATFNTVYQMYYDKHYNKVVKEHGKSWLFMPDLFGYLLTGNKYNEYSIASTSSLIDPDTKQYNKEVLKVVGVESSDLQEIVMPGTVVGTLKSEIQEETGLGEVKVIAIASHDTASAVAATPLEAENEIYLVCGTWCLMGIESSQTFKGKNAKEYGLTNEGGVDGKVRLLKNINGLWFLQQLKKCWNEQGVQIGFPDIVAAAESCNHDYAINAADERFMAPKNMITEIVSAIREQYGIELEGIGPIAKAAYNGLGALYALTVRQFEELLGSEVKTIRMIGGGIQDRYLCKTVAQVTGKEVITGPIEASAIGNILMQMRATGEVKDLIEARNLVKKSFEMSKY